MSVTVKELLTLDIMKNFKVVAGEKGLEDTVLSTEILDFEFLAESKYEREKTFQGDSIVLTSFLFAKDNPDLIVDAVRKLINLDVHALAYKPVFFNKLPQAAIDYANDQNFPILEFGGDEFFEDIILNIRNLIEKDFAFDVIEDKIKHYIFSDFTVEESKTMYEEINPSLRKDAVAICFRDMAEKSSDITARLLENSLENSVKNKVFVGKIEDKYMVILSQDEGEMSGFLHSFDKVRDTYDFDMKKMTIGISDYHSVEEGIDKVIKEAYWAERVAEIEEEKRKNYKDIGIYQLIGSNYNSKKFLNFMRTYLDPVIKEDGLYGDLMETAIAYVNLSGDVVKTGEKLYCHKNTIRYRISKIHEMVNPDVPEKEFYINLSVAVKTYLLHNLREEAHSIF